MFSIRRGKNDDTKIAFKTDLHDAIDKVCMLIENLKIVDNHLEFMLVNWSGFLSGNKSLVHVYLKISFSKIINCKNCPN